MVIGIDASRANLVERTGTEWYSLEIIRALVKRKTSARFVLYLQAPPLPELQNLGPNVEYRILGWPPRLLWSQLRLSWEMWRRRPDVLFVPAHTMPLIHPARTIVTIHDLGFEHYPHLYRRTLIGGSGIGARLINIATRVATLGRFGANELDYHRWSARRAARRAASIITVSEFTKNDIIEKYHAEPNRISVVYHGLNRDMFKRPDQSVISACQKRFAITKPYLLFIGRLETKKNILNLIKVFAKVGALRDIDLVLIGRPGDGWDQAQTAMKDLGIQARVHVLGWQPSEVYVTLLAGAQALVYFSNFEGFGLPILEAFALETPVLASKTTSMPEIAGDAAQLADPANLEDMTAATLQVIDHADYRQTLVTRGKNRVRNFTWERAADQTWSLMNEIS